jgi:hypothetical protein
MRVIGREGKCAELERPSGHSPKTLEGIPRGRVRYRLADTPTSRLRITERIEREHECATRGERSVARLSSPLLPTPLSKP